MSGLEVIEGIIRIIQTVYNIQEDIKVNKLNSKALLTRLENLRPLLVQLKSFAGLNENEPLLKCLMDLLVTGRQIEVFFTDFTNSGYIEKMWKRNSHRSQFMLFNELLDRQELTICLSLGINNFLAGANANQVQERYNEDMKTNMNYLIEILESKGLPKRSIETKVSALKSQSVDRNFRQLKFDKAVVDPSIIETMLSIQSGKVLNSNQVQLKTIEKKNLIYTDDEVSLLGMGGFGKVYKGNYMGQKVAVKVVNGYVSPEEVNLFKKEALAMQVCNFPGIIKFYGIQVDTSPYGLVMELAVCSLYDILHKPDVSRAVLSSTLSLVNRVSILRDISRALEHLQLVGVTHRDLKSPNILIDTEGKPKVTDFGLAKVKQVLTTRSTHSSVGTPAYKSPEIYCQPPMYGEKSDVYAFGVLLNETLTGLVPFENLEHAQIMYAVMIQKVRPTPLFKSTDELDGDSVISDLTRLIKSCWDELPSNRPRFCIIRPMLDVILYTLCGNELSTNTSIALSDKFITRHLNSVQTSGKSTTNISSTDTLDSVLRQRGWSAYVIGGDQTFTDDQTGNCFKVKLFFHHNKADELLFLCTCCLCVRFHSCCNLSHLSPSVDKEIPIQNPFIFQVDYMTLKYKFYIFKKDGDIYVRRDDTYTEIKLPLNSTTRIDFDFVSCKFTLRIVAV